MIDAQYASAKLKIDHLAAKFRRHLQEAGPFLYVREDDLSQTQAARLVQLLSAAGHQHEFRLLLATPSGGADLSGIDKRIVQVPAPVINNKAQDIRWEGDDDGWDQILRGFTLGLPRGPLYTANFNIIRDFSAHATCPAGLAWSLLPAVQPSMDFPLTFEIPAMAWAFSALSDPVHGFAATQPRTLILTIEVLEGHAGVALARADGKALIGGEYWVSPDDGVLKLSLPLPAGLEPARVVLRNYNNEGVPGAIRVHSLDVADSLLP